MDVRKTAYSLVELILVIAIMGALTAVAVPRLQFDVVRSKQAEAFTHKISTDLRRTRSLALRDAATDPAGFALVLVGSTPHRHYEIRNTRTGEVIDRHAIDESLQVVGMNGSSLRFGPLGNLLDGSTRGIRISGGGVRMTVRVVTATGRVYVTTEA